MYTKEQRGFDIYMIYGTRTHLGINVYTSSPTVMYANQSQLYKDGGKNMNSTTGGFLGEAIMEKVRKEAQIDSYDGSYSSSNIDDDIERIIVTGAVTIGVKVLSKLLHL